MNLLQKIERDQVAKMCETSKIPAFSAGDTLKVNVKVVEGTRERIQAFEGVCIARKNAGINSSFTVRKISYNEGRRARIPALQPTRGIGRSSAPRRCAPGQALLPARPARQVGPHLRTHHRPQPG